MAGPAATTWRWPAAILRGRRGTCPDAPSSWPARRPSTGWGAAPAPEDDPTVPVTAYGAVKCVLERAVTAAPLQGSRPRRLRAQLQPHRPRPGPGRARRAGAARRSRPRRPAAARSGRATSTSCATSSTSATWPTPTWRWRAARPRGRERLLRGRGRPLRDVAAARRRARRRRRPRRAATPRCARALDPPHVVGDPARLRELTGWTPRIGLEQSVADLMGASAVPS